MTDTVVYPDAERAVVDLLGTLLAAAGEGASVGVGVPTGWDPTVDLPHLQVAWDGTPIVEHPIVARCTIRVVARAATTTEAKRLAWLAHGLLLGHGGTVATFAPLTGPLPARDLDTAAELCSITLRATFRST